ncbi:acyltransferase family protein [Marinobacterium stanieri]|uniref:acyltransferase family protein n=1 Tax=Marinobacterium stanieri TaxID=49186 RepID=UPI00025592AA|nr:acyltransferase family protein [Marinobacterium stanieri]
MRVESYRPDIQGLRAISVLAVMVFHYNPAWLPGGFVGVDIFLVISGFLITGILLHKKQAGCNLSGTLKYFYASRLKRIAPAYFVMLVLVALVAAVFFLPQDFNSFKAGLEKAAWFNSNNYFADFSDYFAPASHEQPLLHTWSLGVEIQFYLLAPFMVLLLPNDSLKWAFGGFLIGTTAIAEYRLRFLGIEQDTYYSLYARLPEFFAGGLAALYVTTVSGEKRSGWSGVFGLLIVITAASAQPLLGPFPGIAAMLPVVGAVLLLGQQTKGWVSQLLACKVLVWIGALSYSLYLWHWPVLAFLRYYTGTEVLSIELGLLFVVLTLMLSVVSYYGVERVFRIKSTNKKQALGWVLLAPGVLGISQVIVKVNAVVTPEKFPVEYRRYADSETICHGQIVGDCLKGDLASEKEILVLGDSHAAMLNHFFDYLGKELGFKARIITASSCVTFPGFDYQRLPEWAQPACVAQILEISKYLEESNVIMLAGMWSYQFKFDSFKSSLSDYIVSNKEKKIYLLPQIPLLKSDYKRVERFKVLGLNKIVNENVEYIHANRLLYKMAGFYENLSVVDVVYDSERWAKRIPYIYSDESHLNEKGAIEYAENNIGVFHHLIKIDFQ